MKPQSKFNEHFPRPLTCILLVEVLLCGNSGHTISGLCLKEIALKCFMLQV